MLILLGAALVFVAIFVLVMGLAQSSPHPMTARIANLRGERMDFGDMDEGPESLKSRVLGPLAGSLGASLQKILPVGLIAGINRSLIMGGQPTTTAGFLVGSSLWFGTMALIAFFLLSADSMGGMVTPLVFGFCLVLGVMGPKVWLDNRVRHRQKDILRSLPDAFDLITTCVEAGLGLEAALAKVAEKVEGPFGEELHIMLQDVALGKLRRDALREVAERTGVPDLTSFINAVIQAETMGTSIAAVLRVQAEQMRTKRRQRAEQEAQAAPIKMMFPLVLFIFPTMFIVILGPAAISIYEQLVVKGD
jgi:tight adherence protein C